MEDMSAENSKTYDHDDKSIADPASQRSGRDDTSIVPDAAADPAEVERDRLDDGAEGSNAGG